MFCMFGSVVAAQEGEPRPNYLECRQAIEPLESRMRDHMKTACISFVEIRCTHRKIGPWLACMDETTENIVEYVLHNRDLLPEDIDIESGFRARSYVKLRTRLAAFSDQSKTCIPARTTARLKALSQHVGETEANVKDRICWFVNAVGALDELYRGAGYAGIKLP